MLFFCHFLPNTKHTRSPFFWCSCSHELLVTFAEGENSFTFRLVIFQWQQQKMTLHAKFHPSIRFLIIKSLLASQSCRLPSITPRRILKDDLDIINKPMKHLFGLLEEAGAPGENPHIHGDNVQTPYSKVSAGIRTRDFSLWGESADPRGAHVPNDQTHIWDWD